MGWNASELKEGNQWLMSSNTTNQIKWIRSEEKCTNLASQILWRTVLATKRVILQGVNYNELWRIGTASIILSPEISS